MDQDHKLKMFAMAFARANFAPAEFERMAARIYDFLITDYFDPGEIPDEDDTVPGSKRVRH